MASTWSTVRKVRAHLPAGRTNIPNDELMVVLVDGVHVHIPRDPHELRVGIPWMGAAVPAVRPAASRIRGSTGGGVATFDHHAWGLGGDLLWIVICIGG